MFSNKVLLAQSHSHPFMCRPCLLVHYDGWQRWVLVTETLKPYYLLSALYREVCSAVWLQLRKVLVRRTSSPMPSMLKIHFQEFFYLWTYPSREIMMKTLIKCSAIPSPLTLPSCAWSGGSTRILLSHPHEHACDLACFTILLSHNKLKWKKKWEACCEEDGF